MKKRITLLWLAVMLTVCAAFGLSAQATTEQNPIYPSDLNDGTYSISVKSSSSMFRIIDCQLKVSDGKMTAVMTLSGQGYGKLYMGTGEAAEKASESDFIPFVVNNEGSILTRFRSPHWTKTQTALPSASASKSGMTVSWYLKAQSCRIPHFKAAIPFLCGLSEFVSAVELL